MTTQNSIVALIPARAGSKRIIGKNIRPLAGYPLLAYTIAAAKESGIFDAIVISTDSDEYAKIALRYGIHLRHVRNEKDATDISPDFDWVSGAMLSNYVQQPDAFAILRPTSPFRTADTIRRAWAEFQAKGDRFDSLRAVDQKPKQHPWKMWLPAGEGMIPLFPDRTGKYPSHSVPTQLLRQIWPQNASLEIAWTKTLEQYFNSISGERVLPFFTEGYEGYDLNTEDDWQYAEWLVATGKVHLSISPTRIPSPSIPPPDMNPSTEITEGLRLPTRRKGGPRKHDKTGES